MPGVSLLHGNFRSDVPDTTDLFEPLHFFTDYETTIPISAGQTVVGYTGYPEYPVRIIETERAVVLVEGDLYALEDVKRALRQLTEQIAPDDVEPLQEWLVGRDGDYVITIYWKSSEEIDVLTDPFARLPLYLTTIDGTTITSRELKFVREFARMCSRPVDIDPVAAAQKLAFGYPLGTRTVFDGVRSLPPASHVHIGDGQSATRFYRHDFGEAAHDDRSVGENASRLAALFRDACKNRCHDGRTTVVSLSGGLDSRAVAGAFAATDLPFVTATFDNSTGTYAEDVACARTVAETLGVGWREIQTNASPADRSRLLEMKQGMNDLGIAFILDFLRELRDDCAPFTYVTGDGGDKMLVDLSPTKQIDTEHELIRFIIDSNTRIDLEKAAEMTGINRETLVDTVRLRVRSYPETNLEDKYVHFLFRERGLNWLNHGEDRNRYYCWSVSPFYSFPFFEKVMNCPDEQKQNRDLYKEFLRQYAPELLNIEYPNFGAPITSIEYTIKRGIYDMLYQFPTVQDWVVKLLKQEDEASQRAASAINEQLVSSETSPFSDQPIREIIHDFNSYRPHELYSLYTLLTLADGVHAD